MLYLVTSRRNFLIRRFRARLARPRRDLEVIVITDEQGTPANSFRVGEARETVDGDIFHSPVIGGYFPPHAVLLRGTVLEDVGWFDESTLTKPHPNIKPGRKHG